MEIQPDQQTSTTPLQPGESDAYPGERADLAHAEPGEFVEAQPGSPPAAAPAHGEQVGIQALALRLFDHTGAAHGLGTDARRRLAGSFAQETPRLAQKRKKALRQARDLALANSGPEWSAQDQAILAATLVFETAAQPGADHLRDWLAKNSLPLAERREALILAALRSLAEAMQSDYHSPVRFSEALAAYAGLWIEARNLPASSQRALQPGLDLWAAAGLPQLVFFASGPASAPFTRYLATGRTPAAPGITAGDTLAVAGRKIWRQQLLEVLSHEKGTLLGEDIEELHDMRVATRRLRASFAVFGQAFQSTTLKPYLQGLRRAGQTLGAVRDMDVLIEKARQYQAPLSEADRLGFVPLLQSWQAQREAARQNLLSYLYGQDYQRLVREFSLFLMSPAEIGLRPPGPEPSPQRVAELAPILIYSRLAAVRAMGENHAHATLEQLHALRIEFKRFRYAVEFFREALGPEAKAVIDDLKQIQDHLGNMNDAHVAAGLIETFLQMWDAAPQGSDTIPAYLAHNLAERQRLVDTFSAVWEHFNRPEFRRNLALAISAL